MASKKAKMALAGLILSAMTYLTAILAEWTGVAIPHDTLISYADRFAGIATGIVVAYLGAQGAADIGKEKARVEAAAVASSPPVAAAS